MTDFDTHARVAFYFAAAALGICFGVLRLLGKVLKQIERLHADLKSLRELHQQNARFRSDQHLVAIQFIMQLARKQGIDVPELLTQPEDEPKH